MTKNSEVTPRYRQYLESPQWAKLRKKVLERDKYRCQGCGDNRATQAHHLTYRHLFKEFLFELIAVCPACHERLHGPELSKAEEALPYGQHLLAALEKHADARGRSLARKFPDQEETQAKVQERLEEWNRADELRRLFSGDSA